MVKERCERDGRWLGGGRYERGNEGQRGRDKKGNAERERDERCGERVGKLKMRERGVKNRREIECQ